MNELELPQELRDKVMAHLQNAQNSQAMAGLLLDGFVMGRGGKPKDYELSEDGTRLVKVTKEEG